MTDSDKQSCLLRNEFTYGQKSFIVKVRKEKHRAKFAVFARILKLRKDTDLGFCPRPRYTRLNRLNMDKRSSLLDQWVSGEKSVLYQ